MEPRGPAPHRPAASRALPAAGERAGGGAPPHRRGHPRRLDPGDERGGHATADPRAARGRRRARPAEIREIQETVQQAIERLRHLLFELRPAALDRDGLVAALEQYVRAHGTSRRAGPGRSWTSSTANRRRTCGRSSTGSRRRRSATPASTRGASRRGGGRRRRRQRGVGDDPRRRPGVRRDAGDRAAARAPGSHDDGGARRAHRRALPHHQPPGAPAPPWRSGCRWTPRPWTPPGSAAGRRRAVRLRLSPPTAGRRRLDRPSALRVEEVEARRVDREPHRGARTRLGPRVDPGHEHAPRLLVREDDRVLAGLVRDRRPQLLGGDRRGVDREDARSPPNRAPR